MDGQERPFEEELDGRLPPVPDEDIDRGLLVGLVVRFGADEPHDESGAVVDPSLEAGDGGSVVLGRGLPACGAAVIAEVAVGERLNGPDDVAVGLLVQRGVAKELEQCLSAHTVPLLGEEPGTGQPHVAALVAQQRRPCLV